MSVALRPVHRIPIVLYYGGTWCSAAFSHRSNDSRERYLCKTSCVYTSVQCVSATKTLLCVFSSLEVNRRDMPLQMTHDYTWQKLWKRDNFLYFVANTQITDMTQSNVCLIGEHFGFIKEHTSANDFSSSVKICH